MSTNSTAGTAAKHQVSFDVAPEDMRLIAKITDRAGVMAANARINIGSPLDIEMDITAAHANGNPLDLQKLLDADDFNFTHDVIGIVDTIDRTTGYLTRGFSPRCSAPAGPLAVLAHVREVHGAALTTEQHYADEATLTAAQMVQRDADPTGLFRGAEVNVDYSRKVRPGRVYEVSGNAVCVEVQMPRGLVKIVSSRDRVSRRFNEAVAR